MNRQTHIRTITQKLAKLREEYRAATTDAERTRIRLKARPLQSALRGAEEGWLRR